MSSWIESAVRLPKHGQWVVIPFGKDFKVGQFDFQHPFSPAIVDRSIGKYYSGFEHWKPLTKPKGK